MLTRHKRNPIWLLTRTRARTSLQLMEEDEIAHDGTKIKTEFVFGAE